MRHRSLAVLFAALGLPLAWTLALLDPPFQGPDEGAHFLRAVQVGQGRLIGVRAADGELGGWMASGLPALIPAFDYLRWRRTAPLDAARMRAARGVKWGGGERFAPFANTVIYPPWFYGPQAVAIDLGRLAGVHVLGCLRLARLASATVSVLLGTVAIAAAAGGAGWLAGVMALPMTMSLFASASQDGLTMAVAACLAAFVSRRREEAASWVAWLCAGLGLGAVGAARAPYIVLCVLAPILARRTERGRAWAACVLGVMVAIGWLVWGSGPVLSETVAGGGVLGGAQARFLLAHPLAVPGIAWATLDAFWFAIVQQFVGVLNWLDLLLPRAFIDGAVVVLALLLALGWRAVPALVPVVLMLSAGLVFGALYVTWSPVGSPVVIGVQGRYFLPIAAMGAAGLGRSRWPLVSAGLVAGLLVADWLVVPEAIVAHFALDPF